MLGYEDRYRTPTTPMTPAALGLRTHSGWAVAVVVAGPLNAPGVIERRRIEIADPAIEGSTQPYHAAARLNLKEAEEFLKRCADSATSLSEGAVRALIDNLREESHEVLGSGILLGAGRPAPALAATLASHALIHTAEGDFFRRALTQGIERCGLPLTAVRERELWARSTQGLHMALDTLEHAVAEMGRAVGPPWRQDEKYAALVGWLALAGSRR
jgi:hypothetical protein